MTVPVTRKGLEMQTDLRAEHFNGPFWHPDHKRGST